MSLLQSGEQTLLFQAQAESLLPLQKISIGKHNTNPTV